MVEYTENKYGMVEVYYEYNRYKETTDKDKEFRWMRCVGGGWGGNHLCVNDQTMTSSLMAYKY